MPGPELERIPASSKSRRPQARAVTEVSAARAAANAAAYAGAGLPSPESVLALQRSIGNAGTSNALTVQRWKNAETVAESRTLKVTAPAADQKWIYTLHHVIPRNRLKWLANVVDSTQAALIRSELSAVAPTAFSLSSATLQQALENLPANFILGPDPSTRSDDPDNPAHTRGRGGTTRADTNFDGSGTGTQTPRSKHLDAADSWLIAQQAAASAAGAGYKVNTQELQTKFIEEVKAASQLHGTAINLDKNRSKYATDSTGHHYRE